MLEYNVTQYMTTLNQSSANDFPVAKELNTYANRMVMIVAVAGTAGLEEDYEIKDLNRAYVLAVDELQRLYDRNPKLHQIDPPPLWKTFDVLKTASWEISQYFDDEFNDSGHAHNARVEKLCILYDAESPVYTPEQKKLVDLCESAIDRYTDVLVSANEKTKAQKNDNWQIPSYSLKYKLDGTILINDVLKLKKAHAGSSTERLLEQALKNPNVLFRPDLGQTSRNLSTVLSSAGFSKQMRDLFFPTVSKSKGVVFRPMVTRQQADNESIDTTELDAKLKELGAVTEPKTM